MVEVINGQLQMSAQEIQNNLEQVSKNQSAITNIGNSLLNLTNIAVTSVVTNTNAIEYYRLNYTGKNIIINNVLFIVKNNEIFYTINDSGIVQYSVSNKGYNETIIDFTNIYNKQGTQAAIDTKLQNFYNKQTIDNKLTNIYTKEEVYSRDQTYSQTEIDNKFSIGIYTEFTLSSIGYNYGDIYQEEDGTYSRNFAIHDMYLTSDFLTMQKLALKLEIKSDKLNGIGKTNKSIDLQHTDSQFANISFTFDLENNSLKCNGEGSVVSRITVSNLPTTITFKYL